MAITIWIIINDHYPYDYGICHTSPSSSSTSSTAAAVSVVSSSGGPSSSSWCPSLGRHPGIIKKHKLELWPDHGSIPFITLRLEIFSEKKKGQQQAADFKSGKIIKILTGDCCVFEFSPSNNLRRLSDIPLRQLSEQRPLNTTRSKLHSFQEWNMQRWDILKPCSDSVTGGGRCDRSIHLLTSINFRPPRFLRL